MAINFDGANKRIILDSASVTAAQIWSAWVDWHALSDNAKWLLAFRQVGGDDLGGGLSIPPYFFLQNGWRVRPMESSHNLTITGNLFVEGGGVPVVSTLGTFQVNVNYTVPVQAQGISTSGGGSAPSASDVADAVWQRAIESGMSAEQMSRIMFAVLAGKVSGAGTASEHFRDMADTKDRLTVVADEFGNRTSIIADGS